RAAHRCPRRYSRRGRHGERAGEPSPARPRQWAQGLRGWEQWGKAIGQRRGQALRTAFRPFALPLSPLADARGSEASPFTLHPSPFTFRLCPFASPRVQSLIQQLVIAVDIRTKL